MAGFLKPGVRWWVAALGVAVACGPKQPGEPAGTTGGPGSSSTAVTDATIASGTSTASATAGEAASEVGTTEADATSSGSTSSSGADESSTTELGPCVVDPAQDLCTAACNLFSDCCKCNGQVLTAPVDPSECAFKAGIVTAACFWPVLDLRLDGTLLEQIDGCRPGAGWWQFEQGGDIVIQLCNEACETYKAGAFSELRVEMFCEAA